MAHYQYHVHMNLLLNHIMSKFNLVRGFTLNFLKIHLIITFPPTPSPLTHYHQFYEKHQ
jgi:hypothetical protein